MRHSINMVLVITSEMMRVKVRMRHQGGQGMEKGRRSGGAQKEMLPLPLITDRCHQLSSKMSDVTNQGGHACSLRLPAPLGNMIKFKFFMSSFVVFEKLGC
jgi:hypothetical protein